MRAIRAMIEHAESFVAKSDLRNIHGSTAIL